MKKNTIFKKLFLLICAVWLISCTEAKDPPPIKVISPDFGEHTQKVNENKDQISVSFKYYDETGQTEKASCDFKLTKDNKLTGPCTEISNGVYHYQLEYRSKNNNMLLANAKGLVDISGNDEIIINPVLDFDHDDNSDGISNLDEFPKNPGDKPDPPEDNGQPTAHAGPDQSAQVGDTITLDGSKSSDPNNDTLSYQWAPPLGIELSSTTNPKPTFQIPSGAFGKLTFSLVVTDSDGATSKSDSHVTIINSPPIADAGPDQSAQVGDIITLDGSKSSDPNNDTLSYQWTAPAGINLSSRTSQRPTCKVPAGASGTLTFSLKVTDSNGSESTADSMNITITTTNSPPKAVAGDDQAVMQGATVTLNGSDSSDLDGDSLTYTWRILSAPNGNTSNISNPNNVTVNLIANAVGTYTVQLEVSDGTGSARDTIDIKVSPENMPPDMIAIPADSFQMGDETKGSAGWDDELPVHSVDVPSFEIGKYEVTFDEYDLYMNATGRPLGQADDEEAYDWGLGREDRPVIEISWEDVQGYIKWLNEQFGLAGKPNRYRLPTEAEWEYAARAGTTTKYSWGDNIDHDEANYGEDECCDGLAVDGTRDLWTVTAPVGSFSANPWGLYDMHGNIREWVEDCKNVNYTNAPTDGSAWLSGDCSERIFRSGSWYSTPRSLRSAARGWAASNERTTYGFRLARTLPIANAGSNQEVTLGTTITLDGSDSFDPNNNNLTLHWTLETPTGSQVNLSNTSIAKPTFTPDVPGDYKITLTVNDGQSDSVADSLTIIVIGNESPIAVAGPDQTVWIGTTVTFNGSGSFDPDSDDLTYAWSILSAPVGNTADLLNPNQITSSLIPNVEGDYIIQLLVEDGIESSSDTLTVVVSAEQPSTPAPKMVRIPLGRFQMGDETGDGDSDETPVHSVELPSFEIGEHEVTFAEYDLYLKATGKSLGQAEDEEAYDWKFGRDSRPAINVSWEDTQGYIKWLNEQFGLTGKPNRYRLPTEAEWEYAARAGKLTKYSFGNDENDLCAYGNVADQTLKKIITDRETVDCTDNFAATAPIGQFNENIWGLYDMHGNVSEWVEDCWNDNYTNAPIDGSAWLEGNCSRRVVRGGSWLSSSNNLRLAYRNIADTFDRKPTIGFRLARTLHVADVEGSDFYISNINSGRLSGDTIGSEISDHNILRKKLALLITNPNENFQIYNAYATRGWASGDAAYWILSVQNISSETHCRIKLENIVLKDKHNNELITPTVSYVDGSIRKIGSSYDDGCLHPGEIGYELNIDLDIYSQASQIEIGSITVSSSSNDPIQGALLPMSYSVDSFSKLNVVMENTGTQTIKIGEFSKYVYLDNDGLPLHWGFINDDGSGQLIPVGESIVFSNTDWLFEGKVNNIRIIADFSDSTLSTFSASVKSLNQPLLKRDDFHSVDEYTVYMLNLKKQVTVDLFHSTPE